LLTEPEKILQEIILVPGLFEPRFALWPLRSSLQGHCDQVACWPDRLAFRQLETSVKRMADRIAGDPAVDGSIGIVTHSFGDWVARAALAKQPNHRVRTLVSLAPVMRAGFLPSVLYALTGKLIPEIAVIMDANRASANLDCDSRIRRMVVWSKFDESLRRVDLTQFENVETRLVMATHFSIAWQPNVRRIVREFMFPETS
jgi:pimeloyl-ACP methyl ester carboxylesterase